PTPGGVLPQAREVGSPVEGVYGDGDGDTIAAALGAHGATKIYATGDLQGSTPGIPAASALAKLIEGGERPDLILFGTTYEGRDVAARLSVALDQPVLTNNIDIAADGDSVVVPEPVFGGTKLFRTRFTGSGPHLALIRPKSFAAEESGGGPAEVVTIEVPEYGTAKVKNRHVEEHTGPKLDEAAVGVSGGRGLGAAAKNHIIDVLARALKGAPGASRAIVDAGWVPYSYQVGQTGKVVKPTVYIAAGISGATQHLVG